MTKIVVLNGIHTSGKSTVGRYLAAKGFLFFPEIAMDVHSTGGAIGLEGCIELQTELYNREAQRDTHIRQGTEVVESWHTAILAHSALFGGHSDLTQKIVKQVDQFDPLILYLDIDPSAIHERGSKIYSTVDVRVINFYKALDAQYKDVFKRLGLKTAIIDGSRDINSVSHEAYEYTIHHLGSPHGHQ